MEYQIASDIFGAYPGYSRGVVVVCDADNRRDGSKLELQLRAEEEHVRQHLGTGPLVERAEVACWREAYRRFGAKPSEHRSSIESMLRRVLKPGRLQSINLLVDIGNIVSLRHLLPAGVHPLPETEPGLQLRGALPGDRFAPPDGSAAEAPPPGEVVFAHGATVLTRRWTWRQAAGTQTLAHTRDVFFNIDGLPPADEARVRAAMRDIEELVVKYTGGRIVSATVLSAQNPSLHIPPWR
jgi:DNA/RNA-binding domain of Phe-tRNA-synthetase-like protein